MMGDVAKALTELVAELAGHRAELHQKRVNGSTTHYWVVCSCGFETEPGRSYRRHVLSAVGHLKRVGKRLNEEITEGTPLRSQRPEPGGGVSLPGSVGGRA